MERPSTGFHLSIGAGTTLDRRRATVGLTRKALRANLVERAQDWHWRGLGEELVEIENRC
jgi:hypothetical protein